MKQNVILANGIKKKMVKALELVGLTYNSKTNVSVETCIRIMTFMKYLKDDPKLNDLATEML